MTRNIPLASITDGLMAPSGGANRPKKHIAIPATIRTIHATKLVFFISFFIKNITWRADRPILYSI